MGKSTPVVIVRAVRRFEYPKSMLHKTDFIRDALDKARDDMQEVVNEIINNDHNQINVDLFVFEAEEVAGYKFRMRDLEEQIKNSKSDVVNIAKAAKALTTHQMEEKHGPLNHEQNPSLYEHEPEQLNTSGVVVRQECWYMRREIEQEFYQIFDQYREILRLAAK